MIFTFYIPPITFSKFIIDWSKIGFLNYFRAISSLIVSAFLPGACLSKIIFPKMMLPKKFNVEPFFFKLTLYPFLSFTFLSTTTFILDLFYLSRDLIELILFSIIIILFLLNLLVQKYRDNDNLRFSRTEIRVSKSTFLILCMALGIIIIALSVHLSSKYLIPGDSWRAINYVSFIGQPDTSPLDKFYSYYIYWGYYSFSLSSLSGIPFINMNAMLFPFLYLFITSIYLFMKAILFNMKEKYAILATTFTIIFSNLFYIFNTKLGVQDYKLSSALILDGIINFRYKSFAIFLMIFSLALFIISTKPSEELSKNSKSKNNKFTIILLGSYFLLQSFILYFLPILPAFSLIMIYLLFSNNKLQIFRHFLIYLLIFIILFIYIDLLSYFFFSWKISTYLTYFLGISPPILKDVLILNGIMIYSILISILFLIFLIYRLYIRNNRQHPKKYINLLNKNYILIKITPVIRFLLYIINFPLFLVEEIFFNISPNRIQRLKKKEYLKIKISSNKKLKNSNKIIFIIFLTIFFILFEIEIFYKISIELQNNLDLHQTFFLFYLDLLFSSIGLIGILGICLSYFCFKKNKKLFYILLSWGILMFSLASVLIIIRGIQYSFTSPSKIPQEEYFYMMYWFNRIWYYSIIPLSIFASIGLIKVSKALKSRRFLRINHKYLKSIPKLGSTSILIFLSLSNTIITGMYWNNYVFYTDEEAQVIGWASDNIPHNSNILIDRYILYHLEDVIFSSTFYIWDETSEALKNYKGWKTEYYQDSNCNVEIIEKLGDHEGILKIDDQNNNGLAYIDIEFNNSQEYGYIEFFIRTTNISQSFSMNFISDNNYIGIAKPIFNNSFYYYNGTSYNKILDIGNDVWYQLKIYFECTNGNYMGLNQYQWKLLINGSEYGDYNFWFNNPQIKRIQFSSQKNPFRYSVLIDCVNFSWAPELANIEENIFNIYDQIIIDHLKSKFIRYFILSKNSINYYKNKNLIKYFKEKLYEYGDLSIFCVSEV